MWFSSVGLATALTKNEYCPAGNPQSAQVGRMRTGWHLLSGHEIHSVLRGENLVMIDRAFLPGDRPAQRAATSAAEMVTQLSIPLSTSVPSS